MTNAVKNIRKNLADVKGNEAKALAEHPGLANLFERRQNILQKINAACLAAITETRQKYQSELDEIDREYAVMLQFTGDNKEK